MIDPELQQLARRRQNRRLALVFAPVLVLMGMMLVWWASHPLQSGQSPAAQVGWPRELVFGSIPLVLVAVELVVLLRLRRRGVRWLQPSPAFGLERSHRRRLLRAIRHGERLSGRDGELARDTAERLVRQRWIVVVIPLLLVVEVLFVVRNGLDVLGVLVLLAAVGAAVALPFAWRDVRRARRYLALDHEPAAPPPSP